MGEHKHTLAADHARRVQKAHARCGDHVRVNVVVERQGQGVGACCCYLIARQRGKNNNGQTESAQRWSLPAVVSNAAPDMSSGSSSSGRLT